ERVHVIRIRLAVVEVFERLTADPRVSEGRFVLLQLLLPAVCAHGDVPPDLLRIGPELFQARHPTKALFVKTVNQVAGLLELDGEEEGRRDVDSFDLNALSIRPAIADLVCPEIKS